MRVKSCLLASAMVLGFSLSAIQHPAYAADGAREATPMVLAQNNDNRGFLDKLFNRKGENGSARPVYMDKGSSKTKPYDFSQSRKSVDQRKRNTGNVSWEAFEKQRELYALEVRASVQANSDAAVANVQRKLAARIAAEERQQLSGDPSGSKTIDKRQMVYDPEKVWTYNPNERKPSKSPPRLYNPN